MSAPSKGRKHEPVVYYAVSEYGGVVKIGTTNNLAVRMRNLSRDRVAMCPIATEPGGASLESQRHIQFRASQCRGEWFWQTPEVMKHIDGLPDSSQFIAWAFNNEPEVK